MADEVGIEDQGGGNKTKRKELKDRELKES